MPDPPRRTKKTFAHNSNERHIFFQIDFIDNTAFRFFESCAA
jgi:hypothetical protein